MAKKARAKRPNAYAAILEHIFKSKYKKGATEIPFGRKELIQAAKDLEYDVPKNLGDVVYSFRYRAKPPASITKTAPTNQAWVIVGKGSARYAFVLRTNSTFQPNRNLIEIKIPDATPGIIAKYALTDEQALLARVRYNRLIDIFTGITCYSLQSHLRTNVTGVGQIETDEVYIGVDKSGVHYVFPVQAKAGNDRLGTVQIEQDIAMCAAKFGGLVARPIGAQFIRDDLIALFEFVEVDAGVKIVNERHYWLVGPDNISDEDIHQYKSALGT